MKPSSSIDIMFKAGRVMSSCRTVEQRVVSRRYFQLAVRRATQLSKKTNNWMKAFDAGVICGGGRNV